MDFYIIFEARINQNTAEKLISEIKLAEILNEKAKEENKLSKIVIFFSSYGGDIDLGFLLSTVIQNSKIPIVMHATNHIDSVANVIYLSAKTRTAESYAKFYFHGATIRGTFNINELKEKITSLETSNGRIAHYVSENSDMTLDQIKIVIKEGKTISAKEALEHGIVQEISHEEIPSDALRREIIIVE